MEGLAVKGIHHKHGYFVLLSSFPARAGSFARTAGFDGPGGKRAGRDV